MGTLGEVLVSRLGPPVYGPPFHVLLVVPSRSPYTLTRVLLPLLISIPSTWEGSLVCSGLAEMTYVGATKIYLEEVLLIASKCLKATVHPSASSYEVVHDNQDSLRASQIVWLRHGRPQCKIPYTNTHSRLPYT